MFCGQPVAAAKRAGDHRGPGLFGAQEKNRGGIYFPDGKKLSGRSREVRRPEVAARIAWMVLTTTAAVATSPCVPPGIVSVRRGSPWSSIVSPGFFAPT